MTPHLKGWLVVGLLLATSAYAFAEDLTVTTYYPSPRGVYEELRTSGDVKIGDSSSTTPQGRLEVRGSTAASAARALYVGNLGGTARLVVEDGGNVGIGTASPQENLHVVDSGGSNFAARIEQLGTNGQGLFLRTANDAQPALTINDAANSVNRHQFFGNGNVILAKNAGMVTLGGDYPSLNTLTVIGGTSIGVAYSDDAAPIGGLIVEGNVGIGTPSPTETLQVAGIIHSTTGGIKFPDNTVQTSAGIRDAVLNWECAPSDLCPAGYIVKGSYNTGLNCGAVGDKIVVTLCVQY